MQILFDNYCRGDSHASLWGFSAYLPRHKLLFDTGSNGRALLKQIDAQGIDLSQIAYLFITHDHWDHIGGIDSILELNADLTLFLPETLSKNHIRDLRRLSKEVILIGREPMHLFGELYTTGLLGDSPPEQSLLIAGKEATLLTGCGHYGIAEIVAVARELTGERIDRVMGGFHLLHTPEEGIRREIAALQALGVRQVVPTHCTGDSAVKLFAEAFDKGFVEGGIGEVLL